jgi:hypothetical protein
MWSSAAARSFVEWPWKAMGREPRATMSHITGMLLPNTTLKIKLKHIGQMFKHKEKVKKGL